ncbi:DMT family transporter [Cyanothece sp. BG0011]|uniref:DMT family transporter n=1 Tax=Cyanothece sp. BG0011 TaxID=2082950 RepID=UPI000D1DAE1C|nr:DMT family transporter [Cyanothece sp. BG0011]
MNLTFNRSSSLKSALLLIAPFFLWGTAMVAMKGVLSQTTPFFMAGVRLVPAGVLVLLVAWWLKRPQPQGIKAWFWITLFALLDATMFQGFLAAGLTQTGAGLGSVIIDSQPLIVALLSCWLFSEIIGFWGWIGLGFGILGISLIGLPKQWFDGLFYSQTFSLTFNGLDLLNSGELLMLLASLSMAAGTVCIRYVSRYVDPVVATGWHMILGGIPLFLMSGMWESHQWTEINLQGWLSLGYSTIFGSAIAYGIFFYLASKGNLTSLSSLTFLTPVFALSFGNLFLNEVLTSWQWIGVSLTLISIYLINQREMISKQLRYLRIKFLGLSKRTWGKLSETIFSWQ